MKCIVASCSQNEKDGEVKIHRFPVGSPKLMKKWISNMQLPEKLQVDSIIRETSGICSKHFLQKCFIVEDKSMVQLKSNAVPTLLEGVQGFKKIAPDSEALMDMAAEGISNENAQQSGCQTRGKRKKTNLSDHSYQVDPAISVASTRSKRIRTPKIKFDPSQNSLLKKGDVASTSKTPSESISDSTSAKPNSQQGTRSSSRKHSSLKSKLSFGKDGFEDEGDNAIDLALTSPSPSQDDSHKATGSSLKAENQALMKEIFEMTKKVNYQKAQITRLEKRLVQRENKVEDLEYALEKLKSIIFCCECGLKPDNMEEFAKSLKRKRSGGQENDGLGTKDGSGPKKRSPVPNKPTQVICRNDLVVSLTWSELFSRVNSLAEDFEDD